MTKNSLAATIAAILVAIGVAVVSWNRGTAGGMRSEARNATVILAEAGMQKRFLDTTCGGMIERYVAIRVARKVAGGFPTAAAFLDEEEALTSEYALSGCRIGPYLSARQAATEEATRLRRQAGLADVRW